MLTYLEPLDWFPTAEDLPCSDDEQNQRYPTPQEVTDQAKELARQEKVRAKQDRLLAKQDRLLATQERTRAEQERTRAEQAETDRAAEVLRSQRLADRLRELGVDPDQI
jgi:hypothetical protein